jgi:hypothetical protein
MTIIDRIRCFRAVFSAEGNPDLGAVMNGPGVRDGKRVHAIDVGVGRDATVAELQRDNCGPLA